MSITYRRGIPADIPATFDVLMKCLAVIDRSPETTGENNLWDNPEFIGWIWSRSQGTLEYLTTTDGEYWVAEENGAIIGYALSTTENGARELNQFFVLPGMQAGGIGRELLSRSFPADGARRRFILSSIDIRAHVRYLKSGVYPRFSVQRLSRSPEPVQVETDLVFQPVTSTGETFAALRAIDRQVLDLERDEKHRFLLNTREAFLYLRGNQVVGYGYIGSDVGPIALLNEADFPSVLAHAENRAAELGNPMIAVETPMLNRSAVDYMLARGFKLDENVILFMSDEPFGKFEKYLSYSPPFFL